MVFVSSKEGTNFGKDTTFCTTMIMMCRKKAVLWAEKAFFFWICQVEWAKTPIVVCKMER